MRNEIAQKLKLLFNLMTIYKVSLPQLLRLAQSHLLLAVFYLFSPFGGISTALSRFS